MKKDEGDITLRDVIAHIQAVRSDMHAMEKRLTKKIDSNAKAISANAKAISANAKAISANAKAIADNKVEIQNIGRRIDALDEDLTATIEDSVKIRQHVGIPVTAE
jgi:predicted  nucleic acid-binding Zn-ribbon protein